MARPKSLKPAYCFHRSSGRAFVKIDGERKYLGKHGSQESRDAYDRLIGEWIARGRMPAPPPAKEGTPARPYRIVELIDVYWAHVQSYYVHPDGTPTSEVDTIKQALRIVNRLYGQTPAQDFGPKALKACRQMMIGDEHAKKSLGVSDTETRNIRWARKHINKQVSRIRGMFKWGAAQEFVPVAVYQALATVEPLKQGRTVAKETDPVRPVALEHVRAVLPFLSRQVGALVQLQLLTGSRGGELCAMRTRDIDTRGEVWTYTPEHHKTEHFGHARVIRIGPKGQSILRPMLKADTSAYIFSPAEAEAERREKLRRQREENGTPLAQGNGPGDNVSDEPERQPGDRYLKDSYARAIARACDAAFLPPDELARIKVAGNGRKANATRWETDAEWQARLGEKWAELEAHRRAHRFHPHQLRHSAATFIASVEGIEVARIILGHRHLNVTQLYAEADQTKAEAIMRRIG